MTQGKRVAIMAAMVLVFGSLLVIWVQTGNQLAALPAPAYLAEGEGSVLTRLDDRLFALHNDGTSVEYQQPEPGWHYNGLSRVADDALLWRQSAAPGVLDILLRWLRLQPVTALPEGEAGLVRCRPGTGRCEKVPLPLQLGRAFHIIALPESGHWLVSDTARHRLLLLDQTGKTIDEASGLRFPNLPLFHGDSVWLPDTNNHRILQYRPSDGRIGPVLKTVPIPAQGQWRWPTAVLPVADGWWVLVGDQTLSRDRILIFDQEWQYQRYISVADADLEAMARLGDLVLVSDISNRQIHGLDQQGNVVGVWQGQPLYAELLALQQRAAQLADRKTDLTILFVVLLAPAFWLAWKIDGKRYQEQQRKRTLFAAESAQATSDGLPQQVVWASHSWIIQLRWLGLLLPLLMGMAFFSIDTPMDMLVMLLSVMALAVSMFFPMHCVAGSAIGVGPDGVVLRDYLGRQRSAQGAELIVGTATLGIGDLIVQVGNPQQPLFDRAFLKDTLAPHLGGATRITGWQEMARLWQSDYQLLRLAMALGLLAILVMLGILLADVL
jgi:hypothetical protein